jgi:acetyl esterase/lipase
MIESKMCSYSDFPVNTASTKGMKVIKGEIEKLNVKWSRNVEYVDRGYKKLHLQILVPSKITDERYLPEAKLTNVRPTIIYVPGSAWHKQDVYNIVPMLTKVAGRGFVVALVEYRPSEEAVFPAQILDAKAAVRFMKEHANEYSADINKVVIFGDSSGGHTALMTAFTAEEQLVEHNKCVKTFDCSVKGVIDYYGPTNISKMNDAPSIMDHIDADSPEGFLIGRKNVLGNMDLVEPTIVTNYISESKYIPPALIFHGDKDRLVPLTQSALLYEALRDAGKDATFYKIQGADHGGAPFWADSVLDIVEKFIRNVMNR